MGFWVLFGPFWYRFRACGDEATAIRCNVVYTIHHFRSVEWTTRGVNPEHRFKTRRGFSIIQRLSGGISPLPLFLALKVDLLTLPIKVLSSSNRISNEFSLQQQRMNENWEKNGGCLVGEEERKASTSMKIF